MLGTLLKEKENLSECNEGYFFPIEPERSLLYTLDVRHPHNKIYIVVKSGVYEGQFTLRHPVDSKV